MDFNKKTHPSYVEEYVQNLDCIWCEVEVKPEEAEQFRSWCWFGCTYNVHQKCMYMVIDVLPPGNAINQIVENHCVCVLDELILEMRIKYNI